MPGTLRFIATIGALMLGFYVGEALVDVAFFSDRDFWSELLHPAPHHIYVRGLGVVVILLAGIFWRTTIRRRVIIGAALRASEKLYRDVVDNCPDSIIIHRGEKILFMNQVAQDYLNLSDPAALAGLSLQDLIHTDDQDRALQRRTNILSGAKNVAPTDIRVTLPDGRLREATVSSMRIVLDGEPAVLTFCRDVTE